ncbi:MAG: rhomboid family intramembrane serine protease, partial [Chitinophagales bacterium]|nr:rhomboid family intramembrane serine protease [Chitinophagales bacterium]
MFNFRKINAAQYREPLSKAEENQLLYTSIFMPIVFVALMWLVKIFEVLTGISLASWGVFPLTVKGLRGILFSPLIHGDWNHLISNSVPFIILGFLMLFTYRKVAFKAFVFIYLASGFMLWLTGRPSYHIGASNLVYGFAFFLFFSGVFRKDIQSIALSLLIVFLYGGIVWGLLPLDWHISWEGHLMGGISGAFIAFIYRNVDLPP